MNALECLEAYRKAAGFDGWECCGLFGYPKKDARPAWRDEESPGGWFVLPDGWTWVLHNWQKGDAVVEYYPDDGWVAKIRVGESPWFDILDCFPTAPKAFRAAERYLSTSEASDE